VRASNNQYNMVIRISGGNWHVAMVSGSREQKEGRDEEHG
jgi:hypothetical protein